MRSFYAFDGDRIGDKLEYLIISENIDAVSAFSQSVAEALLHIEIMLTENNANIIFSAGDNILCSADICDDELQRYQKIFLETTGCKLSIGVGASPLQAMIGLRCAKNTGTPFYFFSEKLNK